MSKYIPGNQKHLSLEDRIYIENELNKGTSFKDIARFLCKDPTTISKEVRSKHLSDWYHKETFYNAKNFCTIAIIVRKPMPVARSSCVVSDALPVLPAIRLARTLRKNTVKDLIKHLMSVMAARRRSITVPSPTSTITMHGLQTGSIERSFMTPDQEST